MHKFNHQITQPRTTQALSQIFPAKFFLFLYANIVTTPQSSYVEQEDTREVIDIDKLNAEIKQTVANIDRLRAEIDKIVAEIEG